MDRVRRAALTPRIAFAPAAAGRFAGVVDRELARRPAALTVDLAGVDYLDPAGLAALGAAGERAREAGVRLLVAGARVPVYKALQVAGLGGLLGRAPAALRDGPP
jgi:anti-anti-sigma factor